MFTQTIRTRPSAAETDKKQAKVIMEINLLIFSPKYLIMYTH